MLVDRFSRRHSSSSQVALEHFEKAVFAVAAHRPSAAQDLAATLENDDDFVAAWALKGFAALILGREELLAPAAAARREASVRLARHNGGTPDEATLVHALAVAAAGRFRQSADMLEAHLDGHPGDLLSLKLSQSLRFMAGDGRGMLAATERVSPGWSSERPGAGFVYGCHAFALEEAGRYREAETRGLIAVRLEPLDAWGLHAISHVHEMENRTDEGVMLLEATRPGWSECNNFRFHMAWHLSMFHLEEGRFDKVLAIYDEEIRPVQTDDFRDIANAASMLWRLRQDGVDLGSRWEELAAIGQRRSHEATLVFATLHNLLAVVAAGDQAAAASLVEALELRAAGTGDQADVAATVGAELGRLIAGLAPGHRGDFARLAADLPLIGGSHAQRDVFLRTLASMAPPAEASTVLDLRRRLKREDRFANTLRAQLATSEGRPHRGHRHLAIAV